MRLFVIIIVCLIASFSSLTISSAEVVIKEKAGQKTAIKEIVVKDKAEAERDVKKSIVFESLSQLDELISAGVPALALSLLEVEQKKRPEFTADWYAFEYKRVATYSAMADWSALIDRVDWLFETADPDRQITEKIQLWFETQQVIARLQSGMAQQALQQLRRLIWRHDIKQINPSLPSVWRRLIIRAYVLLGINEDAQKALVKYNRDFSERSSKSEPKKSELNWQLLQARILLLTGRPKQAEKLLSLIPDEQMSQGADALRMLAQLQSHSQISNALSPMSSKKQKPIKKIAKDLQEKLSGKLLSPSARWAYSYVAYRAAIVLNDMASEISYLEAMLSLSVDYPVLGESYNVSVDDLWQLYESEGMALSNDNNLLVGDDTAWQTLSAKIQKKSKEKSLYLNVALALNSYQPQTKQTAHAEIVKHLQQRRNGLELINQLYLHSKRINDFSVLPEVVRYQLVDYALNEGEISQAARLMKSLTEPPDGQSAFEWRMRKARVLVLEGNYDESVRLLTHALEVRVEIEDKMLDRYIQVLFDFQTVQQHQKALFLFDLIKPAWLSDKLKREIYFWKAQSFYALEQYDQSALFYLKSAGALESEKDDLWAQSARFKAAGALVKAGIYEDAKKVYSDLLLITASESRKALITQNLQKIRLLRNAVKSGV